MSLVDGFPLLDVGLSYFFPCESISCLRHPDSLRVLLVVHPSFRWISGSAVRPLSPFKDSSHPATSIKPTPTKVELGLSQLLLSNYGDHIFSVWSSAVYMNSVCSRAKLFQVKLFEYTTSSDVIRLKHYVMLFSYTTRSDLLVFLANKLQRLTRY